MNRRGSLRASDSDRDQVVGRLHQAATEGRIGADELEQRVAVALKARTYGELEATVADLPAVRERGRERDRRPARRTAGGFALATVRAYPWLLVFAIPAAATAFALMLAATVVWAVLMIVVMVLGGRPRPPRGPWMYTRHHRAIYGPPRGRARSYWA